MLGSTLETTFCLVRHGQTDWSIEGRLQGRADTPLNETGREQARRTADFLARENWDAAVTSPLSRALETASIIADRLGVPEVVLMEQFVERDYGAVEGLSISEREERFPDGAWPGVEDRELLTSRCMSGLNRLAERYPGQKVIVVSHGAAINSILAKLSGGEIGSGKTKLSNGGASVVRFQNSAWYIESYNVASHLGSSNET